MRMKQSLRHVIHAGPCMRFEMQDSADDGKNQWHHEQGEHNFELLVVWQRITNDGANKRRARAIQNGVQNKQSDGVAKRWRLARCLMRLGMQML